VAASGTYHDDKADHYAAAIYGSIIAAALIEAFRAEHAKAEGTALAVLSTMAVFWIAHVWSAFMGERIHQGAKLGYERVREIARSEWPLVEAAFAPVGVLALGWLGILGDVTAEELALIVCIIQLFAWGIAVGRRAYNHWWPALASGFGNGVLGLIVVSLEVAVLH
jgi:hypothetical protein